MTKNRLKSPQLKLFIAKKKYILKTNRAQIWAFYGPINKNDKHNDNFFAVITFKAELN